MTKFLKETKTISVCQCVMSYSTGQKQRWTNLKINVSSTESPICPHLPFFLESPTSTRPPEGGEGKKNRLQ